MRWRSSIGGIFLALLAATAAVAADDPLAVFVTHVEEARGHLLVSIETRRLGQAVRAGVHAAHPVQELGAQLWRPVEAVDAPLAERVKRAIKRPGEALERKAEPAEYATVVAETFAMLDEAVRRVVPDEVRTRPAFQAEVIRRLLLVVSEEYEESYAKGRIVVDIEYQDGWGFFTRARALWQAARPGLRDHSATVREIDRQFAVLAQAFPGIKSPARPMSPDRVNAAIQAITTSFASLGGGTARR